MKPRLLVVPNVSGWILGEIARQIIDRHGDACDIYYLSELVIRRRPDVARAILDEVDFVHALSESSVQPLLDAGADPMPPLMTWIHHVTSWGSAHQLAVDRSRIIVATTAGWRDDIRARVPTGTDIRVVNYGVDPERFRPVEPARREFGIPKDAFAVGFVGGKPSDADGSRKGLDTLRATLLRVRETIPELHVCFVGPAWKTEVAELRRAGISANHAGFLANDRLPAFYRSLDAYLSTSRVEGGPCTMLEAMACETPVVVTEVGLVPEVVDHGVNGYRASPGDADSLASALAALARDRVTAQTIGQAGRRRVVERFSWHHTLAALADPYGEMVALGERPHRRAVSIDRPRFMDTVHAADALIWSAAQVRRRFIPAREGLQMLRAMWRPLGFRAIASAVPLLRSTASARC